MKKEISIRSSAAEYLTYVASTGDNPDSIYNRKPYIEFIDKELKK